MYTSRFYCDDKDFVYKAFLPEEEEKDRFSLNVKEEDEKALIEVKAKDATSFKAINTSITKLIETYEKIKEL